MIAWLNVLHSSLAYKLCLWMDHILALLDGCRMNTRSERITKLCMRLWSDKTCFCSFHPPGCPAFGLEVDRVVFYHLKRLLSTCGTIGAVIPAVRSSISLIFASSVERPVDHHNFFSVIRIWFKTSHMVTVRGFKKAFAIYMKKRALSSNDRAEKGI